MKNKILILSSCLLVSFIIYSFVGKPVYNDHYTKTELYFGLSKPDRANISVEEWNSFSDSVISKTFTAGSTTIEAKGE